MATPLDTLGSDLRRWWGPTYDDSTGVWEDESAAGEDTYVPSGSTAPAETTTTPGGYMAADFDLSVDLLWTDRLTGITYGSGQYITGGAFKVNGTYTNGDVHTFFRFKDRFVGINAEFGSHAGKFVVGTARTNASVFDGQWHTFLAITTPGVSTLLYLDGVLQTDTSDGFSYGTDWTTYEIEIGGQYGRTRQWDGQIASPFLAYTTGTFTTGQRDDLLDWLDEVVNGASGGPTYTLDADLGTFALSGPDVGLVAGRTLAAETGTIALTGIDAGLLRGFTFVAETGAFSLAGPDVGLIADRLLGAEMGALTLTGVDAALTAARRIDAETGAFALAGPDAGLSRAIVLDAETGAFSLTGQDADLVASRVLAAETGAIVLAGIDVDLVYTQPGSYTLTAEPGTFVFAGGDAGLVVARRLDLEPGSFVLDGGDVGIARLYTLDAEPGGFTLDGGDVSLRASRLLTAETGGFVLSGGELADPDAVEVTYLDMTLSASRSVIERLRPSVSYVETLDASSGRAMTLNACRWRELVLRPV